MGPVFHHSFLSFLIMNPNHLSRRSVLQGVIPGFAALPWLHAATPSAQAAEAVASRAGFSMDDTQLTLYAGAMTRPVKILFLADTHLFRDDARGERYTPFSGRMAKAYNRTKHFKTGEVTNPEACFEQSLKQAKEDEVDLVILGGDIVSFPSEAGQEWVVERLRESGLPWLYTAGNHDWHYEGMEGSSEELRRTWIQKSLLPLYESRDPMMSNREIDGLNVVVMDNSTYEILPEQLAFLRSQVSSGKPFVLALHIPLYIPGSSTGFGCGHPGWGAAVDKNYQIERRPKWREKHTETTMDFHREVFSAPNLLGIFAGHIHRQTVHVLNGIPQVVAGANATGAHLRIQCAPLPSAAS